MDGQGMIDKQIKSVIDGVISGMGISNHALKQLEHAAMALGFDTLAANINIERVNYEVFKIRLIELVKESAQATDFKRGDVVELIPRNPDRDWLDIGFVKKVRDSEFVWVVFLRSFPEANPDNLDEWTASLCEVKNLRKTSL